MALGIDPHSPYHSAPSCRGPAPLWQGIAGFRIGRSYVKERLPGVPQPYNMEWPSLPAVCRPPSPHHQSPPLWRGRRWGVAVCHGQPGLAFLLHTCSPRLGSLPAGYGEHGCCCSTVCKGLYAYQAGAGPGRPPPPPQRLQGNKASSSTQPTGHSYWLEGDHTHGERHTPRFDVCAPVLY